MTKVELTKAERNRLFVLAHQLAEDNARCLIDSYGMHPRNNRMWVPKGWLMWQKVNPRQDMVGTVLRRSVRYLELRGLLKRHRSDPWMVRVRERE